MSVDELVKELDEQTEPHAPWKAAKEDVQKGTKEVREKADYTEETKGPKLIDKVETYATDLYGAMGMAGSGDPQHLAHQLRQDLGKEYAAFREALKIGDVDGANYLVKSSITDKYGDAKVTPVMEKISLLEPEERLEAGKGLVKKVGGTDFVKAITEPQALVQALRQQKLNADYFK